MHVTIIDDEKVLASKISKKLKLNGYTVSEFYSYKDFMNNFNFAGKTGLYIIDLALGDGLGFDIVKKLKQSYPKTKIIMISGYSDVYNKVFGLDLGADDYLTKPFLPEELLARIRAITRRVDGTSDNLLNEVQKISYNGIDYYSKSKEIFIDGKLLDLTNKELLIFDLFVKNKGVMLNKNQIVQKVRGSHVGGDVSDNTLNVTIFKLKKKLSGRFNLINKYKMGYILED